MDFLLEFAFELAGELFLENGIEMADDHRLPKWARILILTCTALVFLAVFGIILLVGIGSLQYEDSLWISLLMFALDAGLALWFFFHIRKALRQRSHK